MNSHQPAPSPSSPARPSRNQKARPISLLAFLAGLQAVLAAARMQAAPPSPTQVRVEHVSGEVEVQTPGQDTWSPAREGDLLPSGARIFCGLEANLHLALECETRVQVAAMSHVTVLDRRPGGEAAIELESGSVAITQPLSEGRARGVEVRTPRGRYLISCVCARLTSSGDLGDRAASLRGGLLLAVTPQGDAERCEWGAIGKAGEVLSLPAREQEEQPIVWKVAPRLRVEQWREGAVRRRLPAPVREWMDWSWRELQAGE